MPALDPAVMSTFDACDSCCSLLSLGTHYFPQFIFTSLPVILDNVLNAVCKGTVDNKFKVVMKGGRVLVIRCRADSWVEQVNDKILDNQCLAASELS